MSQPCFKSLRDSVTFIVIEILQRLRYKLYLSVYYELVLRWVLLHSRVLVITIYAIAKKSVACALLKIRDFERTEPARSNCEMEIHWIFDNIDHIYRRCYLKINRSTKLKKKATDIPEQFITNYGILHLIWNQND